MEGELRSMVMTFRVTELQALLYFAGRKRIGRKRELQERALELIRGEPAPLEKKIRELHRATQLSNCSQAFKSPVAIGPSSTNGVLSSLGTGNSSSNPGVSGGCAITANAEPTSVSRAVNDPGIITVYNGPSRTIPISPEVKWKELPFYDTLAPILRTTGLWSRVPVVLPKLAVMQQSFIISPSQSLDIENCRKEFPPGGNNLLPKFQLWVQVQLRFCAVDTPEEQGDLFPPGLVVKVNDAAVALPPLLPSYRPGVAAKQPSKPLDITRYVKRARLAACVNNLHVSWLPDPQRSYVMSVNLVKRLTATELFLRLKSKRIQPADFTRGRIKEITTAEEEEGLCAPTSLRVSVACPLGKGRMKDPCRATSCRHLQCFDADMFLRMNELKPRFLCPVCNKPLKFGDLAIDGYFVEVISSLSGTAGNDVKLKPDGSWELIAREMEDVEPSFKRRKVTTDPLPGAGPSGNEIIDLEDDVEEEKKAPGEAPVSTGPPPPKIEEPDVVDLSDSSDEKEQDSFILPQPTQTPSPEELEDEEVDIEVLLVEESSPPAGEGQQRDFEAGIGGKLGISQKLIWGKEQLLAGVRDPLNKCSPFL